jgi:hypothetical protein
LRLCRNAEIALFVSSQHPGRRFEIPLSSVGGGRSWLAGFFEFGNDRVAQSTADCLQVKFDILAQRVVQNSEQVAAERCSRRAAQPIPSPDFTDRMPTLIATPDQSGEPLPHVGRISENDFERRGSLNRKLLIQKRQQFVV